MRTVLILAHQCHPFERSESVMGAQRAYQFAQWLPEFGWRAEVFCCPTAPDEASAVEVGASSIIPIAPAVDAGALDRWWWALAETSSPLGVTLRRALTLALFPKGDWSRSWRAPATKAALARVAAGLRGDLPPVRVVIGEHGPDAGLWAARDIARAAQLPWVADFRDSILMPWSPGTPRAAATWGFRWLLRGVSATINVNPHWAQIDNRLSGAPAVVIPNGFDPNATPPAGQRSSTFTVVIHGSFLRSYRLDLVTKSLALLRRKYHVTGDEFKLVYFGLHGDACRDVAEAYGVHDLFVARGFVPREELLARVANAHAVIVPSIDPETEREPLYGQGLVPGKLAELLPLGTPIVLVPGDRGYAEELVVRTNVGVVTRTAEGLATVLGDWFTRSRAGLRYGPAPYAAEVHAFSRREGTRQLSEALDYIVARDSRAGSLTSARGAEPCGS